MRSTASAFAMMVWLIGAVTAMGADWPQYRNDAGRSGRTAETLPAKLALSWVQRPEAAPARAWPRDDRMTFDRCTDVAVAEGRLFFGRSTDDTVVALDAATGKTLWTFTTGAPVRFAPAVFKNKVFAISDDGYLYCLAAEDGSLLRKFRGGPSDDMILGNGRMVSRWPMRGGPAIRDGVLYFASGIWQADGVTLFAMDAESGNLIWKNDTAGRIYMPQPHGGANADSGISAQGYLVVGADRLLVPTGRAVPAGFDRATGEFLYYHLQANGHTGGTQTVLAGGAFYNGGNAYGAAQGATESKLTAGEFAVFGDGVAHASKKGLRLLKRSEKRLPDRKGELVATPVHEEVWTLGDVDGTAALVVAGNTLVLGGDREITLVDGVKQRVLYNAAVDGFACGLAVADGRLYVSTDTGSIYCFEADQGQTTRTIPPPERLRQEGGRFEVAAEEILTQTGVRAGYALDLDGGDGSLALALARLSDLHIYVLCPTAEEVAIARKNVQAHGQYGTRITVHQGEAAKYPYGKYFADLVISARSLEIGALDATLDNLPRAVRPAGGVLCSGKRGEMKVLKRPALAKSGSWTHQYSDLGNTSNSTDEIVKGELHALWFRDVDLEMPNRHGRGHAPLFQDGRMFVEGIDALRAVDAYNGRSLWEFALPGIQKSYSAEHLAGTAVTGSNFCVAGKAVYVHDKQNCYRLDVVTGKKLATFTPPKEKDGKPGLWGFIASDGTRLYGTLANPEHKTRYAYGRSDMSELWGEASTFFALDAVSGKLLWRYDAEHSIRHNAIAIGGDRVFLIDRPLANDDRWDPKNTDKKLPPVTKVKHAPGKLFALSLAQGETLWKSDDEAFGTMLIHSRADDVLLMGYQSTRFKLPSEIGGRLAAYRGADGKRLWDQPATHVTRPVINGQTVYAQGGAWDLKTGEKREFELKRSYGCGQLAASKHMFLFRSATLGYLDMNRGSGVENFGGIRPGCWINALPVGGLVLVPDASAGCKCSYQNRSWMALTGQDD